jgi:serine/threonine protein kinase
MKTYFTKEAEKYYNTEVAAFRHLARRSNPSIIKFYGSFTRGDSYNVILEYADKGTLADYFRNESPPSEGDETIRFWEAIFKLLSALRDIHEVGSDDPDGPQVFQVYVAALRMTAFSTYSDYLAQTADTKM